MAALCQSLLRRAHLLSPQNHLLCICPRFAHSQSLWEDLLGRKIEPAAAKKLEEAFLAYKVRKAVPSWLPFLPNSSFWIPSSEETMKNLEILAERIKVEKPASTERVNIFKAPPDWSDKGTIIEIEVDDDDEDEDDNDDDVDEECETYVKQNHEGT